MLRDVACGTATMIVGAIVTALRQVIHKENALSTEDSNERPFEQLLPFLGAVNAMVALVIMQYWNLLYTSVILQASVVCIVMSSATYFWYMCHFENLPERIAYNIFRVLSSTAQVWCLMISLRKKTGSLLHNRATLLCIICAMLPAAFYVSGYICELRTTFTGFVVLTTGLCVLYMKNTSKQDHRTFNAKVQCRTCMKYNNWLEDYMRDALSTKLARWSGCIPTGAGTYRPLCDCNRNTGILLRINNLLPFHQRRRTVYMVWHGYTIEPANVDEIPHGLYTWISLPTCITDRTYAMCAKIGDNSTLDKECALLSGAKCMQLLSEHLNGRTLVDSASHEVSKCIYSYSGVRNYRLICRVAVKYNTWPKVAKHWLRKVDGVLPDKVVQDIRRSGCFLIYEPCGKPRCSNHSFDWKYDFSQAEHILIRYYSVNINHMAAYLVCRSVLSCQCDTMSLQYLLLDGLKHTFLRYAQKHFCTFVEHQTELSPTSAQATGNKLLSNMQACFTAGKLRHYFINNVNMIENLPEDSHKKSLSIIENAKLKLYVFLITLVKT